MHESFAIELGHAIRDARLRVGLCRDDVASAVRLSVPVYSRLERGKLLPSVGLLRDLCIALRVSSEELLRLAAPRKSPPAAPAREVAAFLRDFLPRVRGMTEDQFQALLARLPAPDGA